MLNKGKKRNSFVVAKTPEMKKRQKIAIANYYSSKKENAKNK